MAENANPIGNSVESFPEVAKRTVVSDELNIMLGVLREAFPDARNIGFEFDGTLKVHIDMRSKERLELIEERLPYLGGGQLFSDLRRGKTPNRSFDHRITALVAR